MADSDEQMQQQQEPTRCAAGCGFFGNPATSDMCSKCWRDRNGANAPAPTMAPAPVPVTMVTAAVPAVADAVSAASVASMAESLAAAAAAATSSAAPKVADDGEADSNGGNDGAPKKPKKVKCKMCKKKLGLLGFECRCGEVFCSGHRHPDQHSCGVDFKEIGRDKLRRDNEAVVADKIENRI